MLSRDSPTASEDSAVSEVISYVLIFGLISLTIAIIILQGTPALETVEDEQLIENTENAVLLVQDRLDEMVRSNAPQREVSLDSTAGLTVGVGGLGETRVNITAHHDGETTSHVSAIQPVHLQTAGRSMVYENGGVIMGEEGVDESWTMTENPSWVMSTNDTGHVSTAFLRSISTRGGQSVSGDGRLRIVFENRGWMRDNMREVESLNITVVSPRSSGWESYFNRLERNLNATTVDTNQNRVTLEIDEFADSSGSVSYEETILRTRLET